MARARPRIARDMPENMVMDRGFQLVMVPCTVDEVAVAVEASLIIIEVAVVILAEGAVGVVASICRVVEFSE